jgi:TonB family protein
MRSRSTLGSSLVVSLGGHAVLGLGLLWMVGLETTSGPTPAVKPEPLPTSIVWLERAGSEESGGESGGNQTPAPARAVRRQGTDRVTVPVARQADPLAAPTPNPAPPGPGLDIPALNLASALDSISGTMRPQPGASEDSAGPGRNGAGGDRDGRGDGPGFGPGVGDHWYRMGMAGVTPPIPLYRGAPRYTTEAVRARIAGSIFVECIVQTTGKCTNARVVRSIEPPYGLDREAIATAGEWRFRPGLHGGEQVPVLVTIEVMFAIR